jgi:hypothetical protein
MRIIPIALIIIQLFASEPATAKKANIYAEGQVWAYRARPSDKGSLIKIQKIENLDDSAKAEPIYHISIVGFRLNLPPSNKVFVPMLPHAPVSRQTLDMSVTRLVKTSREFPSADSGIAEWRAARGGVYTISLAEVINTLEFALAQQPKEQ